MWYVEKMEDNLHGRLPHWKKTLIAGTEKNFTVYKFSRQAKPSQAEHEHVTALPHLIYISYSQLILWRLAKYLLPNHAYMRNLGVWPLDVHDRFPSWKKTSYSLGLKSCYNSGILDPGWVFLYSVLLTIIGPSYPYRGRQIQN